LNDHTLLVIFPETGKRADIPASRVLSAVLDHVPGARGGLARCPHNGTEVETLVSSARIAAGGAIPGRFNRPDESTERFRLETIDNDIIAAAASTKRLFVLVRNLARADLSTLISGETGVGKEIVAHALHEWSLRRGKPFLAVNCAAIPATLLESELFGHVRGAFSGADKPNPGLIESADGGTLFLDEISEAEPGIQAKLLRVLDTRENRPVGATESRRVDVRFIAAGNRRLEEEIRQGRFRTDLFYRLSAARITVPALRERKADILPLARAFLDAARIGARREPIALSEAAVERLRSHHWPGNVRELKNLMAFLAATEDGPTIVASAICFASENSVEEGIVTTENGDSTARLNPPRFRSIKAEIQELETRRMKEALQVTNGNQTQAAALIDMPLRTFVTKAKRYGIGAAPVAGGSAETR
jgi:DNA-binding NtrC family response regulator